MSTCIKELATPILLKPAPINKPNNVNLSFEFLQDISAASPFK
jgi:hypothetical protein